MSKPKEIANLLSRYWSEYYKEVIDNTKSNAFSYYQEVLYYSLKEIGKFTPGDKDLPSYLLKYKIFYHVERKNRVLYNVYLGMIINKSEKYSNLVCELKYDGFKGCDFVELVQDNQHTIVRRLDNSFYCDFNTKEQFRYLINRNGILEVFKFAINDFGSLYKNAIYYKDDPSGFPEKKYCLDLISFIGVNCNAETLTDQLVNEIINTKTPDQNQIVIALKEISRTV